jgi:hypothetical protein
MRFIGNAPVDGEVRAIASGALANGEAVIVNSDGTVGAIDPSGSSTSITQAVGTQVTFLTGNQINKSEVAYDTNEGRVVICYRDDATNYGVTVVGQISGTSLTFGTPVVWNSSSTDNISCIFDSSTGKIVVGGQSAGNSYYQIAKVGQVSGSSISFGSAATTGDRGTGYNTIFHLSAGKVVSITEKSGGGWAGSVGTISGNSISFGTLTGFFPSGAYAYFRGCAIGSTGEILITCVNQGFGRAVALPGSVSGNSIIWGSETTFFNGNPGDPFPPVFDAVSGKAFIAFRDDTGSPAAVKGIAATVSSSGVGANPTVSFGSIASSGSNGYGPRSAYNSDASKIAVTYVAQGNPQKLRVVTISGTTVTFGSEVSLSTADGGSSGIGSIEGEGKFVISRTGDTYNTAVGQVFRPAYTAIGTNLTTENFIGFSNGVYPNTGKAVINSTCTVDKNQSGLTAGQTYYVQTDGTLGTTPADPSVLAGTAISSNSIIVKG